MARKGLMQGGMRPLAHARRRRVARFVRLHVIASCTARLRGPSMMPLSGKSL